MDLRNYGRLITNLSHPLTLQHYHFRRGQNISATRVVIVGITLVIKATSGNVEQLFDVAMDFLSSGLLIVSSFLHMNTDPNLLLTPSSDESEVNTILAIRPFYSLYLPHSAFGYAF
jgi:hypothetical protein